MLRRTRTIMLLLDNIADPHCTSLAKHLSRHCRTNGYKMLVVDYGVSANHKPYAAKQCVRSGCC